MTLSLVELDLYNKKAYISLVGFLFKNTKLFNIPILVNASLEQHIRYEWLLNNKWQYINVSAFSSSNNMLPDSLEEFIYEHLAGYTKADPTHTLEYRIKHPSWKICPVKTFDIKCDFHEMYGKAFEFMNDLKPASVCLAEGSDVTTDWKRSIIT